MSAPVQKGLANAWQGALAGGGDPASSPLYVFGPFLSLLAGAGVAGVTFGTSIWLAVITIVVVSLLYRNVMRWIVDGSGGTGLAEEEFGPWAAKITAALTTIEYTLTFVVSISALVTFVADRVGLDGAVLGISDKTVLAILTSVVCAALVSRGPRTVSAVFGPATAGVLLLLWAMIIAVIIDTGFRPASFDFSAFDGDHLNYTLGGFVRILALMTGIEVFANLVASYRGTPAERSRMAFTSLMIIMGSTAITMIIVGPAILAVANPSDPDVSVFTQTMNAFLPHWMSLIGTALSVLVLLSAAAASALGMASLYQGLSIRHYAPAAFAYRNRAGVPARPVYAEALLGALLFLLLGTDEATYLSIYAAGVFILLSMTAWAAVLRLIRRKRVGERVSAATLGGIVVAAIFTSIATVVLFYERLHDGVWVYGLLVPALAALFSAIRHQRGNPGDLADRMGRIASSEWSWPAPGPSSVSEPTDEDLSLILEHLEGDGEDPRQLPSVIVHRLGRPPVRPWRVCVPLDGSAHAEAALSFAIGLAQRKDIELCLVHVNESGHESVEGIGYLERAGMWVEPQVTSVSWRVIAGDPVVALLDHLESEDIDVLLLSSHGRSGVRRAIAGSVMRDLVERSTRSIVAVRRVSGGKE